MPDEMVTEAIAREEALERVVKTANRRKLAEEDHKRNRHKIDLKLGEQFKAGFRAGLTAKQMGRRIGMSVPRVYQLRDLYQRHIDEEHGVG